MFRNTLMTTTMSLSLVIMGTAQGLSQDTQPIDVPAQPLNNAISELSSETGRAIIGSRRLTLGKTSRAVAGELTTYQALQLMVEGSGLSIVELPDRTFTLTEAASSQDGDVLLDEVVIVEGEKIGRSLQEVTPSIVVLGEEADTPKNFDVREAIQGIPNVLNEEGDSLPSIRGVQGTNIIGGPALSTGSQPRVPVIIDGVPRPLVGSAVPSLASVWDVEAIEVARGPQATTTGRNALAGAVRIQTKDPTNELEGKARINYFNQDGTIGGAFLLNVPIVDDQLAVRFTAEASDGESFVEVLPFALGGDVSAEAVDVIEDEEFRRFRGKVLFTPEAVPGLELKFTVDNTSSSGLETPGIVDAPGDPLVRSSFLLSPEFEENDQTVYSGSVKYEVSDRITVEGRAAFLDNTFRFPPGLSDLFDLEQSTETVTAEGFVTFKDLGRFSKGLFGVAYENQVDDAVNDTFLAIDVDGDIKNIGIFGEAEFDITDKLTLIAGARVEIDSRDRSFAFAGVGTDTSISETAFIPKVGLRYDVNDDLGVGYTYSQGFRPGGVDFDFFDPTGLVVEFDSERLNQHEVFVKTEQLDGRLLLNASAFYYTLMDAQVVGAAPESEASSLFGLVGNIPEARGFGLELDGSFEILDGLILSAGLGLLNTEITDVTGTVGVAAASLGADLPDAPGVTANGGLSYVSDFGLSASVNARFVGSIVDDLGEGALDSYVVVDLAAGYEHKINDRVVGRIDGFINNVADNRYITADFAEGFVVVGRPRTFGISGTLSF
ncbi:MAG: TonB-dependent receptor [Pseudomonadota bacterium]